MGKFSVRGLTLAAMVAALYAVMCYFGDLFGLTFGPVQFRFAEALTVLPFLFPVAAPGLALGCLIANVLSPYGAMDMVFGTLATALAAWLTAKAPNRWLAPLPPILTNLVLLPPIWAWAEANGTIGGAFFSALGFNALTFVVGETVVCYGLGLPLLKLLERLPLTRAMITPERRSVK